MTTAPDVLRRLVSSDPGRPRITVYDDTDSPTRGERVELSARVLANWVAKAANLLQDDLDVAPGSVVRLDLPPHWRTLYWALAVWSVGACVEVPERRCGEPAGAGGGTSVDAAGTASAHPAGVLVTDDPVAAAAATEVGVEHVVLVTLAALARSATAVVPSGAVDEARDLATHGDVFDAWEEPEPDDAALRTPAGDTDHESLVPTGGDAGARVHTTTTDTAAFLRLALEAWAADGSVVLTRGEAAREVLARRLADEGVTRSA